MAITGIVGAVSFGQADSTAASTEATSTVDAPENTSNANPYIVLLNEQTGEQVTFPAGVDIHSLELSAGMYTAYYYSESGDVTTTKSFTVDEEDAVSHDASVFGDSAPSAEDPYEIGVSLGSGFGLDGYTGTRIAYVSVVNTEKTPNAPAEDIPVTITIRNSDADVIQEYERTTDSNGNVVFEVDTTALTDGEYTIRVESSETEDSGYYHFTLGKDAVIQPGIADHWQVGESSQIAVHVAGRGNPVANTESTVEIQRPDGSTDERTVTTNDDGIATFSVTPEQAGEYEVTVDDSATERFVARQKVGKIYLNGQRYSSFVEPETPISVMGQVRDSGLVANEDITVSVVNTTDWDNPTVVQNITTETNAFGQFETTWTPDANQAGSYEVQLYDSTGSTIAADTARITVDDSLQDDDGPTTRLTTEIVEDPVVPGTTATVNLELTQDGEPLADHSVTVATQLGFDGAILSRETITTNETGQASLTVDVPELAPEQVSFDAVAATTVDGDRIEDTDYGELQSVVVRDERPNTVSAGESFTTTYTAMNAETGAGIADIPVSIMGETNDFHATTFSPATIETNSSGKATATIDVPADASHSIHLADVGPYVDSYSYPYFTVQNYEASFKGLDTYELSAGETVSLSYETDAGSSTAAQLVVRTYQNLGENSVLASEILPEGSSTSITIPESVPDGTYYEFQIRTVSESGETATQSEWIRVTNDETNSPPTAALDVTPETPTAGETVTLDASASTDSDGSIASYEWDLDGDGTIEQTGESITTDFDAGSTDVTLTVTDGDGATDSTTTTIDVAERSTTTEVDIVLTDGTDGLQQYNITIKGSGDATVTDVQPEAITGDAFEIRDGGVGAGHVTARAVDLVGSVEPSEEITLLSVGFDSEVAPEDISVTVHELLDDDGTELSSDAIDVQAQTSPFDGPVAGGEGPPGDIDGDGLYEDVNGDGEASFQDAITIAFIDGDSLSDGQVAALDFDGDGDVDFGDAIALAFNV